MQVSGIPDGMVPRVGACQGSQIVKRRLQKSHSGFVVGGGGGSEGTDKRKKNGTLGVVSLDVPFAFASKQTGQQDALFVAVGSGP